MPVTVNKNKKRKRKKKKPVSNPNWAWIYRHAYHRRHCREQAARTTASPLTVAPESALSSWPLLWRPAIVSSCFERERGGRPLSSASTGSALLAPTASPSTRSALLEPGWSCCSPRWRQTRLPPWLDPCSKGERSHRRRKGRRVVGGGREGTPSEEREWGR